MGSDDPAALPPGVLRAFDLGDDRRLILRAATYADASAASDLYGRLSSQDLHRRFFTSRLPSPEIIEHWLSPDREGAALVAELVDGEGRSIIGEAGYSMLPDGDGELAITVDPEWRGWLGSWLLDALVEVAAKRGVPNLHADVLVLNRPMVGLLRHRGTATVEHPDLGQVRMVIGTTGPMPGWAPDRTRPRLLVEGVKGLWWGERLAQDAGFDLRICAGPGDVAERCPVLRGEDCPLIDGADVVLSDFGDADPHGADIVDRVHCRRPELTIVVPDDEFDVAESAADLIEQLRMAQPADPAAPAPEVGQPGQASVAPPE